MAVSTFVQTDTNTQPLSVYRANIDADFSVVRHVAGAFAPHAQAVPDMTVVLDPGSVFNGTAVIPVSAQVTATIAAPVTDPRIDRFVIHQQTGVVSVITGTEAASPVAPSLTAGSLPVAQVLLQPAMTAITNADLTDERSLNSLGIPPASIPPPVPAGALLNVRVFTTTGVYTPTPGTASVIVELVGGGGGAGGTAHTDNARAAASGAGGFGAYAKGRFTSGFAGVTVTVGNGGAGGAAKSAGSNDGIPGTESSFGTLMVAAGGTRGHKAPSSLHNVFVGGGNQTALSTGGNIINSRGGCGLQGIMLEPEAAMAGCGGASVFGGGGGQTVSAAGQTGVSPGAGGGGACCLEHQPSRAGGNGAKGIVIIYEYA